MIFENFQKSSKLAFQKSALPHAPNMAPLRHAAPAIALLGLTLVKAL
jgi:hypothetical protein